MQSRLRFLIALLLLAAAAVHPLMHATATQECPCVHGATVTLDAPAVSPAPPAPVAHVADVPALVAHEITGEVPARAPPAA